MINRLQFIDWGLTLKNGKFGQLREFLSELDSYKKNTKKVRDYLIFESFLSYFTFDNNPNLQNDS